MFHSLRLCCFFLAFVSVHAQNGETKEQPRRGLQPWLTGIIAVVVFLCLCFIGFIVNKIWCKNAEVNNHLESVALEPDYANSNGTPITGALSLKDVRSNEHANAYENIYETANDESSKTTFYSEKMFASVLHNEDNIETADAENLEQNTQSAGQTQEEES